MTLFDVVVLNTYFRIERSGLPFSHRDLWRDELGDLNVHFMGLYFLVADNKPRGKASVVQA